MVGLDHLRSAGDRPRDEDAATADHDHRDGLSARLHPVDSGIGHLLDAVHRRSHQIWVELFDPVSIADVSDTGRDRDIGGGQHVTTEDERFFGDAVADALWTNLQWILSHERSAAEPERVDVRHAEVRAYAADVDGH